MENEVLMKDRCQNFCCTCLNCLLSFRSAVPCVRNPICFIAFFQTEKRRICTNPSNSQQLFYCRSSLALTVFNSFEIKNNSVNLQKQCSKVEKGGSLKEAFSDIFEHTWECWVVCVDFCQVYITMRLSCISSQGAVAAPALFSSTPRFSGP